MRSTILRDPDRWLDRAAAALGVAYAAVHLLAVFRQNVNGDEFVLIARAIESLRTGSLATGGRPGLGTIVLMPFAADCTNGLDAVVHARIAWAFVTFGLLAGIYVFVRIVSPAPTNAVADPERRHQGALLAVGLLALVPVFQRWSVHVRTDQPALAFSIWGAVAFASSDRRRWLALLGGVGFALGYLFTQKAVYVGALTGLLLVGKALIERRVEIRRDLIRVALTAAGAGLTVLLFGAMVRWRFAITAKSLADSYEAMSGSYGTVGYGVYRMLIPTLRPHILGLLLLLGATAWAAAKDRRRLPVLGLAYAVLAGGFGIMVFHVSRFPYFWMTLGLAPALAFGTTLGSLVAPFGKREGTLVVGLLLALLLVKAVPAAIDITADTQRVQRESLAFVERNFPPADRGFAGEKATFCRQEPEPMKSFFMPQINQLRGPDGARLTAEFIAEFRRRPVRFIVGSYRMAVFPAQVQRFWENAYVPYRSAVLVPGRRLRGPAGAIVPFEAVVAGDYVLYLPAGTTARVAVDDGEVRAGARVHLDAGPHRVNLVDGVDAGLLAIALPEPPGPTADLFYDPATIEELSGLREY